MNIDVPDDLAYKIILEAAKKKMSLEDYVANVLENAANHGAAQQRKRYMRDYMRWYRLSNKQR